MSDLNTRFNNAVASAASDCDLDVKFSLFEDAIDSKDEVKEEFIMAQKMLEDEFSLDHLAE
ncbi:MAG: hypothetical protein ACRBHB_18270 [Arenicella sp.]